MKGFSFITITLITLFATANDEAVLKEPLLQRGTWGAGAYLDVATHENLAFVAAGFGGLDIFHINEGDAPHRLTTLDIPGGAWNVDYTDQGLYIAAGEEGVYLIDVTNPNEPTIETQYGVTDYAMDVDVEAGYLYVADRTAGLMVLSLEEINPKPHRLAIPGSARAVHVKDGLALISGGVFGFFTVDLNYPTEPRLLAHLNLPAENAIISGSYALVTAAEEGVCFVDLKSPSQPVILGQYTDEVIFNNLTNWGEAYLITDEDGGLWELSAKSLTNPQPRRITSGLGGAQAVALSDEMALIASYYDGLKLLDPKQPGQVFTFDKSGYLYDLHVEDGQAILTDPGSGRVELLDVKDPQNPTSTRSINLQGLPTDALVYQDALLIGMGDDGLIVDDPNADGPIILPISGHVEDLHKDSGLVYIAAREAGLLILDGNEPTGLRVVGRVQTEHAAMEVIVENGLALVADLDGGLRIIDVSQPRKPRTISTYQTGGTVSSVTYANGIAYLADTQQGLILVDLSNPYQPQLLSHLNLPQTTVDVRLYGDNAYVTGSFGALYTIRVSPSHRLQLVNEQTTPGTANGLEIHDGVAYIADGMSGKLLSFPL